MPKPLEVKLTCQPFEVELDVSSGGGRKNRKNWVEKKKKKREKSKVIVRS